MNLAHIQISDRTMRKSVTAAAEQSVLCGMCQTMIYHYCVIRSCTCVDLDFLNAVINEVVGKDKAMPDTQYLSRGDTIISGATGQNAHLHQVLMMQWKAPKRCSVRREMCISSAWTWNPQAGIISVVKAISTSKIQDRAKDRGI